MASADETSAGGLVLERVDGRTSAALIARRDRTGRLRWSLPKGHVEAGETFEAAAIREVHEETGINAAVLAPLGTIDFWFVGEDRRRIHKTVHHYLLASQGGALSDADEEVAAVAWVPLEDVPGRLRYRDERGLMELVPDLLRGTQYAPADQA